MVKKIDFSKIKENSVKKDEEAKLRSEMELEISSTSQVEPLEEVEKHLCFRLNEDLFSVPLSLIQEVVELSEFTRIPHVPDYVRGLINLRGKVITVIDLRLKLNKTELIKDNERKTCIIISKVGDLRIGFIVDQAIEVLRIDSKDLKPVDHRAGDHNVARYIDGVSQVEDKGIILVLNLSKIMDEEEFNLILDNI